MRNRVNWMTPPFLFSAGLAIGIATGAGLSYAWPTSPRGVIKNADNIKNADQIEVSKELLILYKRDAA